MRSHRSQASCAGLPRTLPFWLKPIGTAARQWTKQGHGDLSQSRKGCFFEDPLSLQDAPTEIFRLHQREPVFLFCWGGTSLCTAWLCLKVCSSEPDGQACNLHIQNAKNKMPKKKRLASDVSSRTLAGALSYVTTRPVSSAAASSHGALLAHHACLGLESRSKQ